MAENSNIVEALKKLDPSNDDQWTSSKQPTVAAVSELVGESVTREQIDAAADGFNRDTAPGFFMTATAKPWEQGAAKADGTQETGPQAGTDVDGNTDAPTEGPKADEDNPQTPANADETDQNAGQNADGDITGVRKDPEEVTAGEDGDNVDAHNEPSGVPSGTGFRETEDSPGPPFNPADPVQAPTGNGGTGPESAAELTTSPRAEGAEADDDTASSGADGPDTDDGASEQQSLGNASDSSDEIASLEEELADLETDINDIRIERDKLSQRILRHEGRADDLRGRLEQLRPRSSNTGTIQAYLERQKQISQEKAEGRQALRAAGVSLKDLQKAVGRSPIDEAMQRKTGRGGRRPTRV
jgi:hypothetical protein